MARRHHIQLQRHRRITTNNTGGRAADSATNASRDRFDLMGRWANVPKKLAVHTPGPKRRLLDPEDCDGDAKRVGRMYWSIDAARCRELAPTAPARPETNTWSVMSRPHIPKWYEG
jgi:hypothetical protein